MPWLRLMAVLVALLLTAAACGDDGEDEAAADEEATPSSTTAPEAGGSGLDPQPLATETTIRVVRSAKIEGFAQMFLAETLGEFAKENIKIEYIDVASQPDGVVLLNTGRADVMPTSPTAGIMNAINGGSELRMVAPIFTPNPESKSGLWVGSELMGDDTAETFDFAKLEGKTIAVAGGQGSPASWTMRRFLERGGLDLGDVTLTRVGAPEQLLALENGAIDAAYLLDPFWLQAESSDKVHFVAAAEPGISLGGFFFGPGILDQETEVGDAFLRAIARTTQEYLQGDYHADPEVVAAIVAALGVPEETILRTPSLVFDPEMPLEEDLMSELQEGYLEEGSLGYEEPLPDDRIVDPSYVERVLGS